jgi:F0F1-type ATP synthase assembly protein I
MLLFVGGGYLVDRHFGMAPLMTVLGAIAGMVSMILYVLRIAREASGHRRGKGDSNGQAD